ncbi:hypothetical protein [Salinisphaera sp. G21_0]|uniref:hypothetical protein n=1 Tax=Salinisphaera sp. G21_0 TaxID=2821094 RepID=UPI001ADB8F00|nr:hypothetical protein [Salinisphaera sp. G21_0]MBO9481914.1 hypothetical protein [Salinisphaera sp. G21_0]
MLNRPSFKGTARSLNDGKFVEDAFWEKKPLHGRKVTSADVLRAYGMDKSSLRSGFFLQKLCLQNILHGNRKVTPDQVIQEFNREPYQNKKYQLAILRFKEECCLKSMPLHGQKVTPEEVVKGFQATRATLELARFKAECCLRGLLLNGGQVTPDEVVKHFATSPKDKLGIARFKEQCCLRGLRLKGQLVTPGAVVNDFPNSPEGQLGIARFKAECCLRGLTLNGRLIKPDEVIKAYPDNQEGTLGIARFKEQCCLRGLSLNDQQVAPDAVVKGYQVARATLEPVRFKAECCLRGLLLNGQLVTPDVVVRGFQAAKATIELARFKEQCCLKGLTLNGKRVTPEAVLKDFPDSPEARMAIARFKAECCLKGLTLNGQRVTPEAVLKDFPDSPEGRLGIVRFKAEYCLRGLPLNCQQIIPDKVVEDYQAAKAALELGHFKAQCCLRGLPLNGQLVTSDAVVKDFPESPEGKVAVARFKAECCLKGLPLNAQQIIPDMVVRDFPDNSEGRLGKAHFKAECCLKGLLLNGLQVTPDEVVKEFPDSQQGKLGIARFKEQCCLKGLPLNGQQVTPEAVVKDFPESPKGKLGIARFKAECFLRGLALNGQQVKPDAVIKGYERGGWLLEKAIFYSKLALNATELNGNYLDNKDVLAAFNEASGDHSSRKARYLMQRLKQSQCYDETNDAQDLLQEAWQILNHVPTKDDEQHRLQCMLQCMAIHHGLPINHQRVSAEQVLQSIKRLRRSFQNSRLHFFFLAQCHIARQSINGRQIHRYQVLESLQSFPEGSKLRHALGCWFERYSCEANIMDELLFQRESAVPGDGIRHSANRANTARHDHKEQLPHVPPGVENSGRRTTSVAVSAASSGSERRDKTDNTFTSQTAIAYVVQTVKQWSSRPGLVSSVTRLNALTLKALEVIQEINGLYSNPQILITGSYARFLQNLCSSFNDIDIICTGKESARRLVKKMQTLNSDMDSEIPKSVTIGPIPGCRAIKLPSAYNIQLKEGDLGVKTMGLQVNIDARAARRNTAELAIHVPGVERPVMCLSFAEEIRLLNDTLEYLTENLDSLTGQLQKEAVFHIPRTILFNSPQNADERIYGLLMRALLTLHKADQFIALHVDGNPVKPDCQTEQFREQQRLHALTENLKIKLTNHICRNDFELRVNNWLSTTAHVNDFEIKRKEFIKALLAMLHPE